MLKVKKQKDKNHQASQGRIRKEKIFTGYIEIKTQIFTYTELLFTE